MADIGVKTVGFIGFADAYGEGWYQEFSKAAAIKGITIVANERYARTDTSVTGQVLKIVAAKPDAVLVAGSGTPAVLPQRTLKERGYAGDTTRPTASPTTTSCASAARTSKARCCRPGRCWSRRSCRARHPVAKSALEYVSKYEAANGKGSVSTFGAHAWDAGMLMQVAAAQALKKAKPGTPEFRAALRDALESAQARCPARTASSTSRRPTTSVSTSAPA